MARHGCLASALVCVAISFASSPSASGIEITISPSSPTDEQTFDLRAFDWFDDSGYTRIDQSIAIDGDQINVRALVQDQHTRPGSAFAQVITPVGAFFDNYGPLAAGTYTVNAELWYTYWPLTDALTLVDSGTAPLTVTGGINPEPASAFLAMAALAASYLSLGRRRS